MDTSDIIVLLKALNQETSGVCEFSHNEDFLFLSSERPSQSSAYEDTTPAPISKASLALTLSRLPHEAGLGCVFGGNVLAGRAKPD
jgi:hypothetical protein